MSNITRFVIYFISILILISFGWWGSDMYKNYLNQDLSLPTWNKPKPLEKYTIENLSKTTVTPVDIKIDKNIFEFNFDPTLQNKTSKKVTGLINLPEGQGPFPVILLLRGYVNQSIYQSGVGTKRVGENLATNNYITLAPDFLGYGGSDTESGNIFETRFQTYTTLLTLLSSINKKNFPIWDEKNIFIWAHSNGGQIALTVLEITEANYPTVLWAPVTENFPYSILFYTNESEDRGKFIRKELAKFESSYDVDKFSLTSYLEKIKAPIEYHWGTNDDAISSEWRDSFVRKMKTLDVYASNDKTFTNYNHPGADHNMNPLWDDVMQKTVMFFASHKN